MRIKPLLLVITVFILFVPIVYGADLTVEGYVHKNDSTLADNAETTVHVQVYTVEGNTFGSQYYCYCECPKFNTTSGGYYTEDLGNLFFSENCTWKGYNESDDCYNYWDINNDLIWANASGATMSPLQGNGSSTPATISSLTSGGVCTINITLAEGPNTPPNITGIPDNSTLEDTIPDWEIDLLNYTTDAEDNVSEMNYTVIAQTNASLINCSVRANRYLNCSRPAANQSGYNNVTVQVNDTGGLTDNDTVMIIVIPVNDAPYWLAITENVNEDTTPPNNWINLHNYGLDIDNSSSELNYSLVNQTNSSLINCSVIDSAGVRYLNCSTPAANQSGANIITLNVSDGEYYDIGIATINVIPVSDPPYWIIHPGNFTIEEDSGLNNLLNLSGYGGDLDNTTDELTFEITNDDTNQVDCNIVNGVNLTATPAANWTGVGANAAQCGLKVYDGQLYSAEIIININVTQINDPPVIKDCYNPNVDEDIDPPDDWVNLSDCTIDIDNTTGQLTWAIENQTNASLINCSISNSYYINCSMPAANQSGVNNLTVNVTDGEFSDSTVIIVTVNPINDQPYWLLVVPNQTIEEDSGLNNLLNLSGYGDDIDNKTYELTYMISSENTAEVDCEIINGVNLTAVPAANWTGNNTQLAQCGLKVFDGQYNSSEIVVYINVTPVNDPPFLTSVLLNQSTGKVGTPVRIDTNGAGDIDSTSYYLKCGNESGNYNLCNSSLGSGERSCSFVTTWTDNSVHTIYCILNDTINVSGEVNTSFTADNIPPSTNVVNNLEGDTVPKYWDTDDDNNITCQLDLAETNMGCRWDYIDLPYSQMNVSRECVIVGQLASCNFISNISGQMNETIMYVSCQDRYGNDQNSSQNTDVVFGVDWTIPDVVHTNDGKIHLPGYDVTLTMKDMPEGTVVAVHYCNDTTGICAPYIVWTGTNGSQKTISFWQRGTWYLRWNATDEAGNVNLTNQTKQTIVFINTLPQISDQVYYNTTPHIFIVNASVYDAVGSSQGVNYSCQLNYRKGAAAYSNKSMDLISGSATGGVYSANISTADGYDVFDLIETYVNCSDGMEWNISSVDSNAVPNFKPSAPVIDVSPDFPAVNDDLYCNITTNSTDPDNDNISYYFIWYKDGVLNRTVYNVTIDILLSGNTTKGEKWNCTVIPYDGYENGTAGSDKVTVGNSAPIYNTSKLIPDVVWFEDTIDDSLNLSEYFYDADNDPLTYHYYYSGVNDITIQINQTTGIVTFIPDANFTGIRFIRFNATDGELWSNYSHAVTLIVKNVNDPPYFDPPLENKTAYENQTFSYDINATDIDPTNDTLTFYSNSTLFVINSSTGLIEFIPNSSQIGFYDINFTVCDDKGACVSDVITLEIVNVINEVIFNIRDRINQILLDDVTITGGVSCPTGCIFNYTITIIEPINITQFVFSKQGFADNITVLNITGDMEVNITMDDNESPVIVDVNITPRLSSTKDSFYIDIIVNVTDNLDVENVSFNYTLSKGFDEAGTVFLSKLTSNIFNGSIGPYNSTKFFMNSSIFANDSYGNSAYVENDGVWFMFVSGNVSVCDTAPVINGVIPDQKKAFNPGSWILNLSSYATDAEDTPSDLIWSVLGINPLFMNISINQTTDIITFIPKSNISGMDKIVFILTDTAGLTDQQEIIAGINRTLYFKTGWNLFSVPIVENNSISYILAPLGNGNWGCGRNPLGGPYDCNSSSGDFEGNWTILWAQKSPDDFDSFWPEDNYLNIGSQAVQTLDPEYGYWIKMKSDMELVLDYS